MEKILELDGVMPGGVQMYKIVKSVPPAQVIAEAILKAESPDVEELFERTVMVRLEGVLVIVRKDSDLDRVFLAWTRSRDLIFRRVVGPYIQPRKELVKRIISRFLEGYGESNLGSVHLP